VMRDSSFDPSTFDHIVVLTGAGVSVASGLRPFRGPDGLWNDEELVRLSDIETFYKAPSAVWSFWSEVREKALAAEPNPSHRALSDFEERRGPDQSIHIITQNVDGLHSRAGSSEVVEYHGSILKTRCSNPYCSLEPFTDGKSYRGPIPRCPLCGAKLRPDIVFFGEAIPEEAARSAQRMVRNCDLFIAAGTSGTVYPASGFAEMAAARGVRTVLVNLEPPEQGYGAFQELLLGRTEELLPRLFDLRVR